MTGFPHCPAAVLDGSDAEGGALDLQLVLTHEVGHTLGLDHYEVWIEVAP